ncbi:MAG TPA: hypothetical protein VGP72_16770 [Planctomycetota bacterium]
MFPHRLRLASILAISAFAVSAADKPVAPAVVSHIKVLSDKIEDVSSLDAWKKSFIKDGMTDEQKGLAVWATVVKFRHQEPPPQEYLRGDGNCVHDPIKTFNVYGYGMCCCASSNIEALGRYAGLKARAWGITGHSVPELFWDNSWHLLDASLICYFPKADGKIAGVEEIQASIADWCAKNPGYKGNDAKLRAFMRSGGWRKGPDVLSHTKAYDDNGWLPAATHGWYSTMQEYDGGGGGQGNKAMNFEYGYSQGYEVNIQLRPGEKLSRNWFNKGLHINEGGGPGCLNEKVGTGQMRYAPAFGDLAPGRIGNGTLEYNVPLASGEFRGSALAVENLACKSDDNASPAVHVKDAASPATLIVRMPSCYVYLAGELNYKAVVGDGGQISVAFSDNNGLDWKDLPTVAASGEQKVDLKPLVFRRYDYRLKFTLKGKGTGLDALKISHDIQHSQRPLPALDKGSNTITFNAGTQEGTIVIDAGAGAEGKGKQLTIGDFHPVLENVTTPGYVLSKEQGTVTLDIATPGDMTRLQMGAFYRARDEKDGWDLQVSFDDGKTFKTLDRMPGLTGYGSTKYATTTEIPTGTKKAKVRYAGTQRTIAMLQNVCIHADYKEPAGGFRPVKITYLWDENGQPKQDVHIAKQETETYTINCAEKPTMKSIVLELAE